MKKSSTSSTSSAVRFVVLILTIAIPLLLGCQFSFANLGNMTSENSSIPTNSGGLAGKEPTTCDEWWSPIMGEVPNCSTQGEVKDIKGYNSGFFNYSKMSDGTILRTLYHEGQREDEKKTPDGTYTVITFSKDGNIQDTEIFLNNPNGAPKTIIKDYDSGKVTFRDPTNNPLKGDMPSILEKKPHGYEGKLEDGGTIKFYRDPTIDSPSSGNWVTETKDADGMVTTVSRNNDGSFNTKSTDSRGITTTTDPNGNWYMTWPKSADGSTKIYYSNGTTVIKKPVPQP